MAETETGSSRADGPVPPDMERRWSAWRAFLTAGLLPATTARRTNHVSLRKAYVVHWVAGLFAFAAILALVSWSEVLWKHPPTLASAARRFAENVGLLTEEFVREPRLATLVVLGSVAGVEVAFAGLALVMAPWGARDEPMRASLCSALQRTWLHTPHAIAVILICGTWSVWLDHVGRSWLYGPPPPRPPACPTVPRDPASPEWQQWETEYEEYMKKKDAYSARATRWSGRSWVNEVAHPLIILGNSAGAAWWLWALFRWVGAPRRVRPANRPPMCETCGYNLSVATLEDQCPECGVPVVSSLGRDVRPGAPWERQEGGHGENAWLRCVMLAVFHPRDLGWQVRVSPVTVAHRLFLARCLRLVFVAGAACLVIIGMYEGVFSPWQRNTPTVIAVMGSLSLSGALVALLAACFGATAVALGFWVTGKRNLMPASMQIASYLSVYLVLLAITLPMTTWLIVTNRRGLYETAVRWGVDWDLLYFTALLAPSALCYAVYIWLVARGTGGARYANK